MCNIWILYSLRLAVENYSSCLVVDVWNRAVALPDQLVQLSDVEQHPGFRLDPILTDKDPLSYCIANHDAQAQAHEFEHSCNKMLRNLRLITNIERHKHERYY